VEFLSAFEGWIYTEWRRQADADLEHVSKKWPLYFGEIHQRLKPSICSPRRAPIADALSIWIPRTMQEAEIS
jgi:hypothetical protein